MDVSSCNPVVPKKMTPNEYIENCLKTENKNLGFQVTNGVTPRIEHAILGIASEGGELVDAMKKAKIYNKTFDTVNFQEELGDVMWYISIACNELGISYEQIWEKNIAKLKARYPEKYSDNKALNRDLATEREILEISCGTNCCKT